jgi:hypothetical protein
VASKVLHEVFVQLLHRRPSLAAELLHDSFGVELDFDLVLEGESILAEVVPAQYRADQVVLLERGGKVCTAIIVEVQLRPDREKRWTWPAYVALLRARLRCPVHLLVVAPGRRTAGWAAKPIALGPRGFVLRPFVIGPAVLPHVTDPREAMRRPELSILSAITHARAADALLIAHAAAITLGQLDDDRKEFYLDVVLAALTDAARTKLEEMMKPPGYEYQSNFARQYFGQGKAEGKAEGVLQAKHEALLAFLAARGIPLTNDERARIDACTDLEKLDTMITRAATARSAREVLADG